MGSGMDGGDAVSLERSRSRLRLTAVLGGLIVVASCIGLGWLLGLGWILGLGFEDASRQATIDLRIDAACPTGFSVEAVVDALEDDVVLSLNEGEVADTPAEATGSVQLNARRRAFIAECVIKIV